MKSYKNECLQWALLTFNDQLNQIATGDNEDTIQKTRKCLERLKLLDKFVDGYASEGLIKTEEGRIRNLLNYTDIYHAIDESEFTPVRFLYQIVLEYLNGGGNEFNKLDGYIARGLRSLTSLLREPDFAEKIKNKLLPFDNNTSVTQCPIQDAGDHTDVLLIFNNTIYRIWLFQFSDNGLPHDIDRLTERRGDLPFGIHMLCPLKTEMADKYNSLLKRKNTLERKINLHQEKIALCTDRQIKKKADLIECLGVNTNKLVGLTSELQLEKFIMEQELEIIAGWYFYSEKYIENVCNKLITDKIFNNYGPIKEMLMQPRKYLSEIQLFEKKQ